MSKETLRINTKEVRDALTRLLGELDKADLRGLQARVKRTEKVDNWLETLRRAERGLKEWCPNPDPGPDQFTIDVPPKER